MDPAAAVGPGGFGRAVQKCGVPFIDSPLPRAYNEACERSPSMDLTTLQYRIPGLAVFRNLKEDPVFTALTEFLRMAGDIAYAPEEEPPAFWLARMTELYADLAGALYETTDNLSLYVQTLLFEDENAYVKLVAKGEKVPAKMKAAVASELETLQAVSDLKSRSLKKLLGEAGAALPDWANKRTDLAEAYYDRVSRIHETGYGIYARYRAFTLRGDKLVPVKHPDDQGLADLYGYERERRQILQNTEALLAGKHANNILLYGDAGTGKSSTIKAIARDYADRGLRLVEVRKNQLYRIPDLMEQLAASPLKFILFIDDLSFSKNDDNFSALKAILEGSIAASGDNVVVYATSNRRHLVKERLSDREGDELYTNDTLQEVSSLSARFGLTITFQRPDKDEYLKIVKTLADKAGLKLPEEDLFLKAEAHAIRCNGRTPRVARQLVELLSIGIDPLNRGKE